jgi:hypothetical protein
MTYKVTIGQHWTKIAKKPNYNYSTDPDEFDPVDNSYGDNSSFRSSEDALNPNAEGSPNIEPIQMDTPSVTTPPPQPTAAQSTMTPQTQPGAMVGMGQSGFDQIGNALQPHMMSLMGGAADFMANPVDTAMGWMGGPQKTMEFLQKHPKLMEMAQPYIEDWVKNNPEEAGKYMGQYVQDKVKNIDAGELANKAIGYVGSIFGGNQQK